MSQVTTATPPVSPSKSWQQRLRESRLGTVLVLAVTTVIVMAGAYLVQRTSGTATEAGGTTATNVVAGKGPAPKIGSPVQDFSATTLDGKQISLSSLKGQPVWLTFGATWCADCVAEAPDIQAASEKFKAKGVVVLSIWVNEDGATVKEFADRTGLTFPKVADPQSSIASQFRVYGIPSHFFIDKTGVLRSTRSGVLGVGQMNTALTEISR
jgi:peroxiredoxin